jgi:hypothetical protein
MRLVQIVDKQGVRRVGMPTDGGKTVELLEGEQTVYALAKAAIAAGKGLAEYIEAMPKNGEEDYDLLESEGRLLPPWITRTRLICISPAPASPTWAALRDGTPCTKRPRMRRP